MGIINHKIGKTYWIDRHGEQVPALVKAMTKFQAQVELDTEDDPIWIQLNALGEEVVREPVQEEPIMNLLANAHALIERAMFQIMNQGTCETVNTAAASVEKPSEEE